jgi:glycosyltransferase involved in cell wall biosynthesis
MDKLQIAIPTYNRNVLLEKLLSTIPSQFKVIVSDNGAFTNQELKEKFPNAKFISHNNVLDVFANWNVAAKNVNSTWVIIPSDDDIFHEEAFTIIENYIEKYPNADMLLFGHDLVNENDEKLKGWNINEELEYSSPLGFDIFKLGVDARMPSVVFKTSLLKKLNYFDESYKLTAGDSDLIQRALLHGNVVFIPKIISAYRVWAGALTSQKIATKLWLDEIDLWQDKISELGIKAYKTKGLNPLNFSKIKDEVYGRNLIAGLSNKRKKGSIFDTMKFLLGNRFPWRANHNTKLQIIKAVLIK